jgi:DNA ligase-1
MNFLEVSERFTEMSNTSKRLELTDILVRLLKSADKDLKKLVYLTQGKLLPDYEGLELGMANKLIIKALSSISGKKEEEIDVMFTKEGDLGTVAKLISEKKTQNSLFTSELSVDYVYDELTKLARIKGEGSIKNKMGIYQDLLLNATPDEGMYITRIITGRLRLGVSDATILDALVLAFADKKYSDEIDEAYNFHPDLGELAELLREGKLDRVLSTGPTPMVPAKVMLGERLREIPDVLEKMGGKAAFEYKYDGLRTQIHIKDGKVKIFSRGSEETTSNFPDIVEHARQTFNVESCILDGEAVPYNSETGELYPFQMVSQRRGRKYDLKSKVEEIPVVVFLFDIIYLNGEPLNKMPYLERRKMLESLFTENDDFKCATMLLSSDVEEINRFFTEAINSGCEGLMAKNVSEDSIYRAGARGWLWIKFKRDYQSSFEDTLDLVIIGAFGGHGRRKGTYGALLMATYNKDQDVFESICKLGTGFTDDVLFGLPARLSDFVTKKKPARVESGLVPDVWFDPQAVLEIIGAEITISPVHSCAYGKVQKEAGLAIRFPRFTGRWRDDKTPEDATTTEEILEMYYSQKKVG